MAEEQAPATNGSALALVREQQPGDMLALWSKQQDAFLTSVRQEAPEAKQLVMKCLGKSDATLKELVNVELPVRHWFLHEVALVNEATGEEIPSLRLVLLLADGRMVSTTSAVVGKAWGTLVKLYGDGPWEPPVRVTVKSIKGRGPNSYLAIADVKRDEPAGTKAPAKK